MNRYFDFLWNHWDYMTPLSRIRETDEDNRDIGILAYVDQLLQTEHDGRTSSNSLHAAVGRYPQRATTVLGSSITLQI